MVETRQPGHSGRSRARRRRLSRSGDFDRVYRQGTSTAADAVVLYVFEGPGEGEGPGGEAAPRLGVSVSRKLGGAVERNRVKRLLREAFWAEAAGLKAGGDVVLVARPPLRELVAERGLEGLRATLAELIARSGGGSAVSDGEAA